MSLKDIALRDGFHIHAELASLTDGVTDWNVVLEEVGRVVSEDTWVILEHVLTREEGEQSIELVKSAANDLGLDLGLKE